MVSFRPTLIRRSNLYVNKLVCFDLTKTRHLVTPLYQMNFPDSHFDKSTSKNRIFVAYKNAFLYGSVLNNICDGGLTPAFYLAANSRYNVIQLLPSHATDLFYNISIHNLTKMYSKLNIVVIGNSFVRRLHSDNANQHINIIEEHTGQAKRMYFFWLDLSRTFH